MTSYSAVVESGSCSMDYEFWEEASHCGHKHRTIDAAEKCLETKQQHFCNHGHRSGSLCNQCLGFAQSHHTSATWSGGTIHDQLGRRV